MKSVIVYYSFSGNTKKVSEILCEYLQQKGSVQTIELKPLDESSSFFGQAQRAFLRKRARIDYVEYDLSKNDLVCLGTPVWAFGPAPAMNTYLDKCFGLEGKQVIIFTTYGSGAGNKHCLNYMQKVLTKKGAKDFKQFSIQQFKAKDSKFILSQITDLRL